MKSNKNNIRILFIFFCFLIFLVACNSSIFKILSKTDNIDKPIITSLAKGPYCEIESGKDIVINSKGKWQKIWEEMHKSTFPQPELPEVDFTEETVLATFMGTRSTGGYSIVISNVKKDEGKLVVIVKTQSPGPGKMVTTAITRPYHIVKVNIPEEDFEFKRK